MNCSPETSTYDVSICFNKDLASISCRAARTGARIKIGFFGPLSFGEVNLLVKRCENAVVIWCLEELDIFKLDIIARELKALDNELGLVGKEAETHDEDCEP